MIFRLGGVDTARFLAAYGDDTIMPEQVSELLRRHNGNGYELPRAKIWLFTTTRPNELLCNCTRVIGPDRRELNTLFAADFTDAEIEGRRQVREYARFFRDHLAGCEASFVNDTGVQVGVRQTRQAVGIAMLRNEDVVRGTKCAGRHCALALAHRASRGREAAGRVAAGRLVRSALRVLRAATRARACSSRGVACPRSTRRSHRLASRPSASRMARRSGMPPACAIEAGCEPRALRGERGARAARPRRRAACRVTTA